MVRITDCPDMASAVHRGRKATNKKNNNRIADQRMYIKVLVNYMQADCSGVFFLIFAQNIDRGFKLEPPH